MYIRVAGKTFFMQELDQRLTSLDQSLTVINIRALILSSIMQNCILDCAL